MHKSVIINGQEYELQISARKVINDGRTAVLMEDSETEVLVAELDKRGWTSEPVVAASFVAVWGDGTEIATACKVNIETREVFDIEQADVDDDLGCCEEEFVEIDGERYPVYDESEYEIEDGDYWYN